MGIPPERIADCTPPKNPGRTTSCYNQPPVGRFCVCRLSGLTAHLIFHLEALHVFDDGIVDQVNVPVQKEFTAR